MIIIETVFPYKEKITKRDEIHLQAPAYDDYEWIEKDKEIEEEEILFSEEKDHKQPEDNIVVEHDYEVLDE